MRRLVEGMCSRRCPANEMGCRECLADMISYKSAWPTRWVAGGVWPTRWVVGGVRRMPGNKHQNPEGVREKDKGWSTLDGCGEIQDEIER